MEISGKLAGQENTSRRKKSAQLLKITAKCLPHTLWIGRWQKHKGKTHLYFT
jgi:hypothetical protein